jgi:hypothetical protein
MHDRSPPFEAPEYLALFDAEGRVHVRVQFDPKGPSIAARRCEPETLLRLIDPTTQLPWTHMRFDGHLCRLEQVTWKPATQRLTLHARPSEQDSNDKAREGALA